MFQVNVQCRQKYGPGEDAENAVLDLMEENKGRLHCTIDDSPGMFIAHLFFPTLWSRAEFMVAIQANQKFQDAGGEVFVKGPS